MTHPAELPQPIKCYYCSEPVLAAATHCSKCGKERKDLNDVRQNVIGVAVGMVGCWLMLAAAVAGGSWSICTSRLMNMCLSTDVSASLMLASPLFWLIVLCFACCVAGIFYFRQRYATLAGKPMGKA